MSSSINSTSSMSLPTLKRKDTTGGGGGGWLLPAPEASSHSPSPLQLLMEVMQEALEVLRLVEESRQDEGLGLGMELKGLSRLVTSTVAVCQKALQGLSAQLLALQSSRYAVASSSVAPAAAAATMAGASMPAAAVAAAAAPLPPAGAYYGGSGRNAPSSYTWGEDEAITSSSSGGSSLTEEEEEPDAACLEYLMVHC